MLEKGYAVCYLLNTYANPMLLYPLALIGYLVPFASLRIFDLSANGKQQNFAHLPHFDAVCFVQPLLLSLLSPPLLLHLLLLLTLHLLVHLLPPLLAFYCCCCFAVTPWPVVALLLQLPAFYLSHTMPHATCHMLHAACSCKL